MTPTEIKAKFLEMTFIKEEIEGIESFLDTLNSERIQGDLCFREYQNGKNIFYSMLPINALIALKPFLVDKLTARRQYLMDKAAELFS